MSDQIVTTAADEARAQRAEALAAAGGPRWLADLRRRAFARFESLGWPTTKLEDWRHTDVRTLVRARFAAPESAPPAVDRAALAAAALPGLGGPAAVFVGGRWASDAGAAASWPNGVRVESLAATLAAGGAALEPHLGRLAAFDARPFVALNTALAADGVVVRVPAGVQVERPIEILFLGAAPAHAAPGFESHPRVLVLAEAGSRVTVVEVHAGGERSFTNAVTEIAVGPGAGVVHWTVQRAAEDAFHFAATGVRLERDARFVSGTLQMGAALARNEVDVVFAAPGGDCQLDGLFVLGGAQHADLRTTLDHAVPHCTSRQLYKGVLGGRAHGVFNGRIVVGAGAQGTAAYQTNRNVILSDTALVDTKPQLEILADDVKCTHGATIGRLDEDAFYYLRTRGIDPRTAHGLLVQAFVHDVVSRARPAELQPGLDAALAPRLAALGDAAVAAAGRTS